MLLAQHSFPQRQLLSVDPLGLFVAALTAQHLCQIVHAPQRRWMLLAEHYLYLGEMKHPDLVGL